LLHVNFASPPLKRFSFTIPKPDVVSRQGFNPKLVL